MWVSHLTATLTNHHITPLVINILWGWKHIHANTHTHAHACAHTHTHMLTP